MRTGSYNTYHGRTPFKKFIKILLIVLLILVVLGIAATMYLQQYLVVSADGVRLDLSFLRQEDPAPAVSAGPSVEDDPVVIVTPTPQPTPEPTPTPEAKPLGLVPVVISTGVFADGAEQVPALITAAGGDCALFDMKTDEGGLTHSSAAQAQYGRAAAYPYDSDHVANAMFALEDVYTVARVSCFRDDYIFQYSSSYPLYANSGDRWIDSDRIHWLAPTDYDVRAYLTAVCVELAERGFDEILLDNAGYPTKGNLQYIRKGDAYNADSFSTVIDGFYAQVISALAEYDVTVSVVTTQAALNGEDALSGQTPDNLARFDRLWMADENGVLAPLVD